jgi:hypothetical protein
MARAKTSEQPRLRSKAATAVAIEELTRGAGELKEFLSQVEDLGREGFPYMEAARARTELQFRECIRRTFGEKSPEFQAHRQHRLLMGSPEETRQSIALIKSLIAILDQKKLELQGGPPPQQIPTPSPIQPIPAAPQLTLVPASISTIQMTMTQTGPIVPPPVAVASTANLALASVTAAPSSPPAPPLPTVPVQKPETLTPATPKPVPLPIPPAAIVTAVPPAPPQPAAHVSPEPQPPLTQAAQPAPAGVSPADRPLQIPRLEPEPIVPPTSPVSPQPKIQDASPVPTPQQPSPAMPVSASAPQEPAQQSPQAVSDSIERVKTLCCRFHSVARQLRLRGEYRTTLTVEDEVDAQDLLHALLRTQFDNIETDEWIPNYSNGASRTTLLLNDSRLAVIVKKTRPGLNAKDITDQLKVDAARYRYHGRCTTLLCFMYDPDGRIGNPQGLESSLTSVSDAFVVEVLVAPK